MASKMIQRTRALAKPAAQMLERRMLQSLTPVASNENPFSAPLSFPSMPAIPSTPVGKTKFPMPVPEMPKVPQTANVSKEMTPLMQVVPRLYAKLEGFQAGGSIKDRAVMQVTMGMLESGKLKPGETMAVCTSGNAGRSLLHVQKKLAEKGIEIKVKIFMPKRYLTREQPTAIANTEGVKTVEGDRESSFYSIPHGGEHSRFLHGLDGEFMECQAKMLELVKDHGWSVLDQHFDVNSREAHKSTAQEVLKQLPSITDIVCTTGTGGTAAGLRKYLPDHVNVHARPAKPGDIDGITDVRRYDNFCNVDELEGFSEGFFDKKVSVESKEELKAQYGITAGESSGAAFALAKDIMAANPDAQVVFIAADGLASKKTLYESQVMPTSDGEP